jgi:catalase-peroxidase
MMDVQIRKSIDDPTLLCETASKRGVEFRRAWGGFGEILGNDVSDLRPAVDPNRRVLAAWRAGRLLAMHTREGLRPDLARNCLRGNHHLSAEELLVDRAKLLTSTAPEMTVLIGGLRVLNANAGQSPQGVFSKRPETLTNNLSSTCST